MFEMSKGGYKIFLVAVNLKIPTTIKEYMNVKE